jgi:hypothetical protein
MAHRNDLIPMDAAAVTPSDAAFVNLIGLYVGGTGNVAIRSAKGNTVTFSAVPAGAQIALGIVQVLSTGTTATNLVGYLAQ